MVNSMLVAASVKSIVEILREKDIPYNIVEDDAYKYYMDVWSNSDDQELILRQARPAIRRIASKEPYLFLADGEPLRMRFNDTGRILHEESFGEILLERPDKDWRISLSVKNNARVIASMPVADREEDTFENEVVSVYNEIDDFGMRIFGYPNSNKYFEEVNEILEKIKPRDKETWRALLGDESFVYDEMIVPMLNAIGEEIKGQCLNQPDAPRKLLDYFYGKIDYYYINPIEEVQVTRIGAANPRKGLGRIPNNSNLYTPGVDFPTRLLDVRFANGKYGELSRDTIQFSFDGGWALCITVMVEEDPVEGSQFVLNVFLPVTPFGSYRDQVDWDPEV